MRWCNFVSYGAVQLVPKFIPELPPPPPPSFPIVANFRGDARGAGCRMDLSSIDRELRLILQKRRRSFVCVPWRSVLLLVGVSPYFTGIWLDFSVETMEKFPGRKRERDNGEDDERHNSRFLCGALSLSVYSDGTLGHLLHVSAVCVKYGPFGAVQTVLAAIMRIGISSSCRRMGDSWSRADNKTSLRANSVRGNRFPRRRSGKIADPAADFAMHCAATSARSNADSAEVRRHFPKNG